MTQLEKQATERVAEILKEEIFIFEDTECVVLSDAEQCYIQGYKDAINIACNKFKEMLFSSKPSYQLIEEFRKIIEV